MKNWCLGLLMVFLAQVSMAQLHKCDPVDSFNVVTADTLDDITIWWSINDTTLGYNLRYRMVGDTMWKCEVTLDTFFTIEESDECVEYEFALSTICPFDTSLYFLDTVISFCPTDTMAPPPGFTDNMRLFPNPVTDRLTVDLSDTDDMIVKSLTIYDLQGRAWIQQNEPFTELFIDTENWPRGVYMLVLETNKKTFVEKILKN